MHRAVRETKVRPGQRANRIRQEIPQRFLLTYFNCSVIVSISLFLARMPPRRKAENSAARLAVLGRGRSWRMCDDGSHRARVQGAGQALAFNGTGAAPCPAGSEGRAQRKIFFNGTKLPISLKTKGRGGRLRKTKLPFAPSAGARQEETLARRSS
jgi:hypothetical protein